MIIIERVIARTTLVGIRSIVADLLVCQFSRLVLLSYKGLCDSLHAAVALGTAACITLFKLFRADLKLPPFFAQLMHILTIFVIQVLIGAVDLETEPARPWLLIDMSLRTEGERIMADVTETVMAAGSLQLLSISTAIFLVKILVLHLLPSTH